jgi:hypothetical protein
MPIKRFWFQLSIFAAALALAVGLAFLAEHLCRAVWLPGETAWTIRHLLAEAVASLAGVSAAESAYCAGGSIAQMLNSLVPWLGPALLVLAVLQSTYEGVRNRAKRHLMVMRGGHTVLLGEPTEIAGLIRTAGPTGRTLLLPSGENRAALAGAFWRHVTAPSATAPETLGLAKARRVFAVSQSDFRNRDLAMAAAAAGSGKGEVVLRIESAALRSAQSHFGDWQMEEFSLLQGMMREGAALGDPGRRFRQGRYPAHVVFCGGGSALDELALHLAGFGYGQEIAPPLFTVIQTDGRVSPAIERLARLAQVLTVSQSRADRNDAVGLERALVSAFAAPQSPVAIHCIDDSPAGAASVAMIAAKAVDAMEERDTAILAYGQPGSFAVPGVRAIVPDDLTVAIGRKASRDRIARAVHEHYLALQRRTLGAAFGNQAAERPWEALSMAYRDDNRAVADHIDHMLLTCGFERRANSGEPAEFEPAELERMARMAHARWLAARALKGWRYGPERDNRQLLHPSMIDYADLSEPEKEKDRDQIRAIPSILALVGEAIYRRSEGSLLP